MKPKTLNLNSTESIQTQIACAQYFDSQYLGLYHNVGSPKYKVGYYLKVILENFKVEYIHVGYTLYDVRRFVAKLPPKP